MGITQILHLIFLFFSQLHFLKSTRFPLTSSFLCRSLQGICGQSDYQEE